MGRPNPDRKRILLVEDHEDAWDKVAYNLEEHALFYARDFNEWLRLARQGYFDLYIPVWCRFAPLWAAEGARRIGSAGA